VSATSPFLTAVPTPQRPFASALPVHGTPEVTSPWTPKPLAIATPTIAQHDEAELAAARTAATEAGRAAGLAETAELRANLARLIAGIAEARTDHATKLAELVADASIAVIGAWLEHGVGERRELFTQLVRGWLQRTGDGGSATAQVHPGDAAAMREAIGDALIAVEPDAKLRPGDVSIRGVDLEITHSWQDRLGELRDLIAAAAEAGEITPTAPIASEIATPATDASIDSEVIP
jgi:flagellar biosynthesis/type III secretory pathway protein FliH